MHIVPLHDLGPVKTFEPPNHEVPTGDSLEVIHKNEIDRRTAERADNRNRTGGCSLGDDGAKSRRNFRNETADERSGRSSNSALGKESRSVFCEFAQQRP